MDNADCFIGMAPVILSAHQTAIQLLRRVGGTPCLATMLLCPRMSLASDQELVQVPHVDFVSS